MDNDLFNIFKNEGLLKTLYVYQAKETVTDPYEKNTVKTFYNPLPIKALVRQITQEALRWKYYGLVPTSSIEVIADKKYKTLFRTADRIKYGDNYFNVWKDDSQGFAIMEKDDYVIVVLAKKGH